MTEKEIAKLLLLDKTCYNYDYLYAPKLGLYFCTIHFNSVKVALDKVCKDWRERKTKAKNILLKNT